MTDDHDTPTLRMAVGPTLTPIAPTAHLLEPVIRWAESSPDRPIAATRVGDEFVDVTARELYGRIRMLAKGLLASGVRPGDRVAIMSHTRLEWLVVDYAILAAGAVTVPIYETSSIEQVEWILSDSGAVLAVVETPEMREMVDAVHPHTTDCREAVVIDEGGLDDLVARGGDVDDDALDARLAAVTVDQLATIVYTSGTTGRPKGCMQTHRNLRTNVLQNLEAVRPMLTDDEVSLLFLPLAHTLAKIIALVCVEWGTKLAFATDMAHVPEELSLARPTLVVSVPRVFEKVFNKAEHRAYAEGHGSIFRKAEDVAIRWSENATAGRMRPVTTVEHTLFGPVVYRKIQEAFGGRLRFAVSGGGPLGERLTHFFNGVGVRVFEGYGLTETSPTLTLNHAGGWKPGTVGRPLAGTTIRIAGDGEILARGPQVFEGYWRAEAATADTFDADGWFRTGDIGELDADGFLRITGRKKELIVTAAGKNVAPAPLEDHLRAHPLISQAVVVGDQRPFVAAMLALDEEELTVWASDQGLDGLDMPVLLDRPDLRAELQAAVDAANRSVSKAESIRTFAVLPRDLTIASGELTPTLKVRRMVVAKSYDYLIEEMYG
ncbi:MAG TPA: long-chain fatty acid--CoA ligase [Acidimicrobiales bacterium]|nr:long-chain fatty acid--CoA ligase [Acidimicrobiales bacterium]